MGRIKTKLIKRKTKELMKVAKDDMSDDFVSNKAKVGELMTFKSKKMRNIVAGYATRLKKVSMKE